MPETRIPARYISTELTNANIASGAAIATSKLADAANFILRGGSVAFTADQSMGGFKLTNVATATVSTDAVNLGLLDTRLGELFNMFDDKGSCRAATTGNINLSNPGTDTFDGVTLTQGQRLLVKSQSTQHQNGIYIFDTSSTALTRATNMDAWTEVPGAWTTIEEGSTLAETIWLCSANQGGTLGSTNITWVNITPSAGGLSASNFVHNETPSGSINGSNTGFTLANTPTAGTVQLILNGIELLAGGNDYSISGTSITMTTAPLTGEWLRTHYLK